MRAAVVSAGTSSASSCFDLVVIFLILICVDFHFKVPTFGCWAPDANFDGEVIRAWAGPWKLLLLQTLAHKITKQRRSNSSEYLERIKEERGVRLQ